jgi:hypothetical protein
MPPIDCVYIAASALDARYTRICVASVRFFYPDIPIRLLAGGRLEPDLCRELQKYWNVERLELAEEGDYGWGFVKLEPLFGRPGERFLVLDSDTVMTGRVLCELDDGGALFVVDDENQTEENAKKLYYDWEKVREIDAYAQKPRFLFNSGQWFGTAGIITRSDFSPWLDWTLPRKLRHPSLFMPGDQGILNYIINQKALLEGWEVKRRRIMQWPAHSVAGLDVASVANRSTPARIVHWAGLKKPRQRDMLAADLLAFFETFYYSILPAGRARRVLAGCRHFWSQKSNESRVQAKLAILKYIRRTKAVVRWTIPTK